VSSHISKKIAELQSMVTEYKVASDIKEVKIQEYEQLLKIKDSENLELLTCCEELLLRLEVAQKLVDGHIK